MPVNPGRALVVAVLLVAARDAVAEPVPRPCRPWAWTASRGTVSAGRACLVAILTTDASGGDGAPGRMQLRAGVRGLGRFAVTVQRLTADPGTIQIEFPGGWLVVGDGQLGVYTSEAQWATDGYRPMAAAADRRSLTTPVQIELVVTAGQVAVRADHADVGVWALPPHAAVGEFAVALRAATGRRARVRVSDWVVPAR